MKLIALIYFTTLSSIAMAQSTAVKIDFEIDGKQTVYKSGLVKFIYDKDTISSHIENGEISIPESMLRKRAVVIFCIDRYRLIFDSIPVVVNNLFPHWTIGIDKKPFNKKKFGAIKSWKGVKIVYYFNPNDGRIISVDGYKKSQVIIKCNN